MHKTISITIGGAFFNVEESAYQRLEHYLKSVRAHFQKNEDSEEIVSDIEDRIAEEFSQRISGRKKVILGKDVDDVIKIMGTVEDFERFDSGTDDGSSGGSAADWFAKMKRVRLYRDADDQVIAGVCSGIANYIGIDPIIVRVLFGLSVFMGGFGVVLYIILWICLPEARTTAEKVEMTQGRVTLDAIQKRIDEAVPPEKRRGIIRKIVSIPVVIVSAIVRFIGSMLRFVVPLIARVIGFVMILGIALAIAFITFVLLALLINPSSPYIGFPLSEAVGITGYILLLCSAYFVALMPLIILILVASSFMSLRYLLSIGAVIPLLSVWVAAIVTGAVTTFTLAPKIQATAEKFETEHVHLTEREVSVAAFTGVTAKDNTRVNVVKGSARRVLVETTADNPDAFTITVDNGTLMISRNEKTEDDCVILCFGDNARITVEVPSLEQVSAEENSGVSVSGLDGTAFTMTATGNSWMETESLRLDRLTANSMNNSFIRLEGIITELMLTATGNSNIEADEVKAIRATAEASGNSYIRVEAEEPVQATASGNSRIDDGKEEERYEH